jgi:ABC-type branched-subunit amino acid transport system permease subunit
MSAGVVDRLFYRAGARHRRPWMGVGWLVLILLAIGPLVSGSPYIISVGVIAVVYVGLAESFDWVSGRIGLLSFAQVTYWGTGAYVVAVLAQHGQTGFIEDFVFAVVASVVVAGVVGLLAFRVPNDAFAMVTLGFAEIAYVVALGWVGVTGGALCLGASVPMGISIGGWGWVASSLSDYYIVGLLLAAGVMLLGWQVTHGRIGRSWHAIRDDEYLAAANGIPVFRYKMLAMMLGAVPAGALGAYFASYSTIVCPSQLYLTYSTFMIVMLYLGGRGTAIGPVLGAIVFSALPEYLRIAQEWQMVYLGVLIVLGAMFIPQGIWPLATKWVARHRLGPTETETRSQT